MPRRHAHTLAPLAILSVALAGPGAARAQQVANAADVQATVDSVFAGYDRTNSPGCAVGVIHDGRLVYARGYGMANLDLGSALAPSSVFRIASTSKQFTAAVMVLAEQEGVLSLDDDVRKWLPELPQPFCWISRAGPKPSCSAPRASRAYSSVRADIWSIRNATAWSRARSIRIAPRSANRS